MGCLEFEKISKEKLSWIDDQTRTKVIIEFNESLYCWIFIYKLSVLKKIRRKNFMDLLKTCLYDSFQRQTRYEEDQLSDKQYSIYLELYHRVLEIL